MIRLTNLLFAMLAVVLTTTSMLWGSAALAQEKIPLEYFMLRPVIRNVEISPDGQKILLLKTLGKESKPLLEVYDVDNLREPLIVTNANPMEFIGASWISDTMIAGQAYDMVGRRVRAFGDSVFAFKFFTFDIEEKKFDANIEGNFSIANPLPNDPDKILIIQSPRGGRGANDPFAAFGRRNYYTLDLETGARSLVLRGSSRFPQATFDSEGNPRFTQGIDIDTKEIVYYYRQPGDNSWREFARQSGRTEELQRDGKTVVSFDKDDPSKGTILGRNGADKIGLWEFNFETGEFGDLIYRNDEADLLGIVGHSLFWGGRADDVAAVTYPGEKFERYWLNEEEQALHEQLMGVIPNAFQLSITSRSRDGNRYIVNNSGPKDPGTTYLVKDGTLQVIGKNMPLVRPEQLADVEYVKYPARDGLMIPAYITTPARGEPPFPTVVLPHGGPYVNEVITWEEWSQMLANEGYLVIQPQYRGSTGHGWNHFWSALNQYGLGMQDDKDDGALYLIQRGLADPDRIAMFGWSYGGYAALIAAAREDQLYQCAVGGAAPADSILRYNNTARGGLFPFADEFARQRGGYAGINPITVVEKINIPLFVIHGKVDDNVQYEHYERYKKAVDRAGIQNVKFMTMNKADHGLFTWQYREFEELYSAVVDYLANDCGPGGL